MTSDVDDVSTPEDVTAAAAPVAVTRGPADLWSRHRSWLVPLAVVAFLAQMAVGMVTAARQESTTVDEVAYLGAAVTYAHDHDLADNYEHPPLTKLLEATGLAFVDVKRTTHFDGDQWALGEHLLYDSGNDAQELLFAARLPMIILTLLFGLVVFAFARDLTGPAGGLLALLLYAFSPDVIGYGSLAGVDLPTAGFLLTALWLLWRARSRPYLHLPLAGVALGAATASKATALPGLLVGAGLAVVSVWFAGRAHHLGRPPVLRLLLIGVAAAAGVVAVAIATVWVTYLIVDPHLHWVTPRSVGPVHGLKGELFNLLPLPRPFLDGMRLQLGLEKGTYSSVLFGDFQNGARWYYLPGALLIKEPLGMLALWLIGSVAMLRSAKLRPAALYLLLPTAVLTATAMAGNRNWGVRYAIFVPVILAVVAAAVLVYRNRWPRVVVGLLAAFVAISSLAAFPYYLTYSNEAFGGPSKTYLQLTDSNVDWGQDMSRLGDRLARRYPGEQAWLIYKGRGRAAYYGVPGQNPLVLPPAQVHGLIAISVRCLTLKSACLPDASVISAKKARANFNELLATSTRIDNVGNSIFIYRR
ncbi:glycosyltransferase [Actinoplanes sp. SE50]|uniref:ArnT family glycosyltransferase n=1 Tax=unclassified Actinoplanes TaxID=2626549 RepID=UPI00023EC277|nr:MULTISPECIES: glycosyltransferase family 39 protein [unclassified Actinoplanes]AEV84084.1 glycosyl transferase family protein [Actinoplanes sp. SE50/110]ATO82476.1 glycosyltransferase [Actinoplanes sp. SE50]SLL99883.1 glycosyl transferase [Actinoplanes sp. SE50/110]